MLNRVERPLRLSTVTLGCLLAAAALQGCAEAEPKSNPASDDGDRDDRDVGGGGELPDELADAGVDGRTPPNPGGAGPDAGGNPGSGADAGAPQTDGGSAGADTGTGPVPDAGGPAPDAGGGTSDAGPRDAGAGVDAGTGVDAGGGTPDPDPGAPPIARATCGIDYGFRSVSSGISLPGSGPSAGVPLRRDLPVAPVAHVEPAPRGTWLLTLPDDPNKRVSPDTLVMPDYWDEMPLFERGGGWDGSRRCYELPTGAFDMNEAQAYDLYVRLIEQTLWLDVDQTPGRRTVVGVRGAWPGTFAWHGNSANLFNDTIVLLWRDADGTPNVREFPVNTDTGAHDFGRDSSSSLRPNRHYPYVNGWHRSYNALRIDLPGYPVRDDANNNGHWDSPRNGWLNGGEADYDRMGSAHNIHMGSVDAPLGTAAIETWSAGCQVIPGNDNWIEFITNAWTGLGDDVDYYLLDARDIAPGAWEACDSPDGSHGCPFEIRTFPYSHSGNTATGGESVHDVYNCSTAREWGNEYVYVMNVRTEGTLNVAVTTTDAGADPDVHLLEGDSANACLTRGHTGLTWDVTPGRYVLVVDSWTNNSGVTFAGPYRLSVTLE